MKTTPCTLIRFVALCADVLVTLIFLSLFVKENVAQIPSIEFCNETVKLNNIRLVRRVQRTVAAHYGCSVTFFHISRYDYKVPVIISGECSLSSGNKASYCTDRLIGRTAVTIEIIEFYRPPYPADMTSNRYFSSFEMLADQTKVFFLDVRGSGTDTWWKYFKYHSITIKTRYNVSHIEPIYYIDINARKEDFLIPVMTTRRQNQTTPYPIRLTSPTTRRYYRTTTVTTTSWFRFRRIRTTRKRYVWKTTSMTTTERSKSSSSLSGAAIAGIVIASIFVLILIYFPTVYLIKKYEVCSSRTQFHGVHSSPYREGTDPTGHDEPETVIEHATGLPSALEDPPDQTEIRELDNEPIRRQPMEVRQGYNDVLPPSYYSAVLKEERRTTAQAQAPPSYDAVVQMTDQTSSV